MTREEEIKNAADEYSKNIDFSDYDAGLDVYDAFIAGVNWADAHQSSPLISVEDRLPKEDENYLALFKRNNYMCTLEFKNNYWKVAGYQSDITHWMPIPKLYV